MVAPVKLTPPLAKRLVVVTLVEVRLVKIPVDGVELPIGVLLIVPPEIVRASVTMPSVMELAGKLTPPLIERLVLVRLVVVALAAKKLVEVRVVPEAFVNKRPAMLPVPET